MLSAADTPGVLVSRLHADGRQSGILSTPGSVRCGAVTGHPFLRMDGQAVFKLAVKLLADAGPGNPRAAGLKVDASTAGAAPGQCPHPVGHGLTAGLPLDRVISTVGEHANTSAASVPLALAQAVQEGRLRPGQLIMLQGVGGGFTWASNLIRL